MYQSELYPVEPGFRLHCHEEGKGEPLVLLHGNGESGEYFQKQLPYFSKEYRVLAVDTRGHGQSPRGTGPFSLFQFSEDLRAFLDERGIGRISLLGFSDGGNIALLFALQYPERVRALILNGANLRPGGVRPMYQIPVCLGYAAASIASLIDRRAVPKRELLGLMVREPHIPETELVSLRVPTLVITGDHDMIRTSHSRRIAAALPYGRFCMLPGSHFIAAEASGAFNECVGAFLRKNREG